MSNYRLYPRAEIVGDLHIPLYSLYLQQMWFYKKQKKITEEIKSIFTGEKRALKKMKSFSVFYFTQTILL